MVVISTVADIEHDKRNLPLVKEYGHAAHDVWIAVNGFDRWMCHKYNVI